MAEQFDDVVHRIAVRPGGSGGRGRGPWYLGAFVAVLIVVVAFGLFGEGHRPGQPPAPDGAAIASFREGVPGSAEPSRSDTAELLRPALPDYPNTAIPGAPGIGLGTRAGADLELRAWWPGDESFARRAALPGVYAAGESFPDVVAAPNLRYGVTVGLESSNDAGPLFRARLVGSDGVLWESIPAATTTLQALSGPRRSWPTIAWSRDSTKVAIGGGAVWSALRIDEAHVSVAEIRVAPEPTTSASLDPASVSTIGIPVPVGFSLDGRWLYGATDQDASPHFRPALRVDLETPGGAVEIIERFPAGGRERLAPTDQSQLDPASGRVIEWTGFGRASRTLSVFEVDGTPLSLPGALLVGGVSAAWAGDGRLFVAREVVTDEPWASVVETTTVAADGSTAPWTRVDGRLTGGTVIAGGSGFVVLDLRAGAAERLVMLRVADGATGTIDLPASRSAFMALYPMIAARGS